MPPEHIVLGIDESGKGDFFGPLVIASFLADDRMLSRLTDMGVRDGKLISVKRTLEIDDWLRDQFVHEVIVLTPVQYNQRYREIKNLNKLLAAGHAEAIARVAKTNRVDLAVSDKFGKPELIEGELGRRKVNINLKQIVRGESILQVAAASILARARFIREMERLSVECGMELPRGAAPKVDQAGRQLVRRLGPEILEKVAKLHFKNYSRIVNPTLFEG
ncbi:MAG: ribonuclease HIII [candidate division Zixibacteria bacterium]|nr:ribonuclease HIII [candidate division Zixibacteria bacterium]